MFINFKTPKILIGIPTSDKKNYCYDEFFSRVKNFTYKNIDIYIVDNSDDRKNVKRLRKDGFNAEYVKPKTKSNIAYITESQNMLRRYACKLGYDFMLHLESDIIPPHDIIERLLIYKKKIISGMYMINFGKDSHLMLMNKEKYSIQYKNVQRSNFYNDFKFIDGKIHQVYTAGLGCILIHRSILNQIPFRYVEGNNAHADTYFSMDLDKLQIPQFIDTSILCEHHNTEWIYF